MRRSKVSSQGQSGGERRSDGGAEIDLDSSPISATPGDEKRSKGARMRGSNMQRRMANRGQPALRLLFGKGVVFVVSRGFLRACWRDFALVWFVSVMGLA